MRFSLVELLLFGTIWSPAYALELRHAESARELRSLGHTFADTVALADVSPRAVNQTELQELPHCADSCIEEVLPRYSCNVNDSACFCGNGNLTASMEACVQSNCTIGDGLAAQKFQANACNVPVRNRGPLTRRLNWAMFALGTLFVAGRFVSRAPYFGGSGFSWDDWTVLFCYVLLIATDTSGEYQIKNGLGQDMYMLPVPTIANCLKWFFIGEIFYSVIVMMTKVSLVLLYLRIWTADSVTKAFRVACWVIIAVLTSTAITSIFAVIFQCDPVPYAWLMITGEMEGKCMEFEAFSYTFGALNISYDVIVFFLPIHSLLKLRVPWPKKLGLCAVFLVGFLVTICSIVRLQYLVRIGGSKNITYDFQFIGMWSFVEANFSVVCCCMPAMAGLAQRIWIKCFGTGVWSYTNGSMATQKRIESTSDSSRTSPGRASAGAVTDAEMQLEKGERHARENMESHRDKVGEVADASGSDRGQTATAILYRDRPNAQNTVEISHQPPTRPSRTTLHYRDRDEVLHEVTIIDRPLGRIPGPVGARGVGDESLESLGDVLVRNEPEAVEQHEGWRRPDSPVEGQGSMDSGHSSPA